MGKPEGKDHLEDQGLEETVILKWLCRKLNGGGHGLERSGSG